MVKKAFRLGGFMAAAALVFAIGSYRCSGSDTQEEPADSEQYDPDIPVAGRAVRTFNTNM